MKHEPETGDVCCPECGHSQSVTGWPAISRRYDTEATQELLRGKLFEYTCEQCGYFDVLTYTSVYLDEDYNAAIVFGRTLEDEKQAFSEALPFVIEELDFDTCIIRWVTHVDDLSEKARIFDCGLDDRAVEVAKLAALRWRAGKDELHELSKAYFGGLLENGGLLLDVIAVSDTANEQLEFFRSKYDIIAAEIHQNLAADKDIVVDQSWAEHYVAESAVKEASDLLSSE